MARFFDKINEASARFYDGLSDRERRLLNILFIFVTGLVIVGIVFLATSAITSKSAELERSKAQLSEIKELEADYVKAKQKNERARMAIERNDVSLFTFIQAITTKLGLSVKDLNEQRRPLPKSEVVEVSVRLSLSKLSIDRVTALIEAIETSEYGNLIRITRLKVSKRFDEPDLLDLQMTVSTWKSA